MLALVWAFFGKYRTNILVMIALTVALAVVYAWIYSSGYNACQLEHKADQLVEERAKYIDLQKQIAGHIAKEKELQVTVDALMKERDKLAKAAAERRRQGEKIIEQDAVNRSCIVPDASMQYLEDIYGSAH